MTIDTRDSELFTYTPEQWRMIHYLRQGRTARWPGSPSPGNNVSTHYHDARRLVERQGAQYGDLQMFEHYGKVTATVGLGGPPIKLLDLPRLPKTGRASAQIKVSLTPDGRELARDPMHLILQAARRGPRRYLVSEVAKSAGISQGDVKGVLLRLEAYGLIETVNDHGELVPLRMWSRDIPPGLRIRLTRKGGTYLARK